MDATDTNAEPAELSDERVAASLAIGIDLATGFATDGEWPLNHRLRAEAMAKANVTGDPQDIVSDDLIAATGERVEREEAEAKRVAAEEARDTPSMSWSKNDLVEEAGKRGLTVETDANKATILAAIKAAPAASQEG